MTLRWMHVQEYDFNDPRGHFTLAKDQALAGDGTTRYPDVGDEIFLACVEPDESFGCVVTVTKVEDSVRDGYLRYETDLGQQMAEERARRDT